MYDMIVYIVFQYNNGFKEKLTWIICNLTSFLGFVTLIDYLNGYFYKTLA